MFHLFKSIASSGLCWFLLFVTGIALECCGLYFQYELHLDPCVNCVYERAFMLGFVICGFFGAITASFAFFRFICTSAFLATSIGGLIVVIEHYNAYSNTSSLFGSSCKLQTNFPDFLPLDQIAPFMFKAYGVCSDKLNWEFLGQSMPFWVLMIFSVATVISALMFLSNFVRKKSRHYSSMYD